MRDIKRLYDDAALQYDEDSEPGARRRRVRFRIIEHPLRRLLRKGDCLDLGCGTGRLLREVASRRRNIGIDLSIGMLKKARAAQVPLAVADAHTLPFAGGSFSSIVASNGVFRYLDTKRALTECRRVLRSNGLLAIHQYSQRTWSLRRDVAPVNPAHVGHPRMLTRAAEDAGFETQAMYLWRPIRVFPYVLPIPTRTPGNLWGHIVAVFKNTSKRDT